MRNKQTTTNKTPIWPPVAVGQPIPYGHPMTEELKNGPYGDKFTFEEAPVTLHPFEAAGLGQAPFRFLRVTENVYCAPGCLPKAGGSCDYCSTGIRYEFWVQGSKGPEFKVGCDCILKLGRADNALISDAQRAKAKLNAQARAAKAEARREAQRLARLAAKAAEEAAQRVRNNGPTDAELAAQARAAEAAKHNKANQWLLSVLERLSWPSDFVDSICSQLERVAVRDLSPRQQNILRDIYAKAHGRRGSKAYEAAADQFNTNTQGE